MVAVSLKKKVRERAFSSADFLLGIFFFKQKTAYEIIAGDWSSDVCSSDLDKVKDHYIKYHSGSLISHLECIIVMMSVFL